MTRILFEARIVVALLIIPTHLLAHHIMMCLLVVYLGKLNEVGHQNRIDILFPLISQDTDRTILQYHLFIDKFNEIIEVRVEVEVDLLFAGTFEGISGEIDQDLFQFSSSPTPTSELFLFSGEMDDASNLTFDEKLCISFTLIMFIVEKGKYFHHLFDSSNSTKKETEEENR